MVIYQHRLLLTLQAYLTWQDECNFILRKNHMWALIAEPLWVAGSVELISQCESMADYTTRLRLIIYHWNDCVLPLFCERKEITLTQYVWYMLCHKSQSLKVKFHQTYDLISSIHIYIYFCQYESSSFAWKSTFLIIQIFQTWHKQVCCSCFTLPVTIFLHKIYLCTRPHIYTYLQCLNKWEITIKSNQS